MKPLFVVGGLYSKANGVAWIMRDLATALGRAGAPVHVYAADCYGRGLPSIGDIFEPPCQYRTRKGLWLGGLSWSPALKPYLRKGIQSADVVHNHSVWMLPNSYASRIALAENKPLVITAHGALEPWALQNSGWKKRLVGRWFQYQDLKTASCIHVNSHNEMRGIRQLGLTQPVAVIPNGIHLPDFQDLPDKTELAEAFPATADKRLILYMGRIHRKKGVDILVEAWGKLADEFSDAHLVVAGPDDGLLSKCTGIASRLNIHNRVTFTGNLQGRQKLQVLSAATLFVMPSHSEGFSMSVMEALACRLPVLLTPGCNFPEAATAGAAIEVAPTIGETYYGLRQLLELSDDARDRMGEAGCRLIREEYTWDIVATKTLTLYAWLCSQTERPSFVCD